MSAATPVPSFNDLGLSDALLRSLVSEGYDHPTPIQAKAIPPVLAGRDVLGSAQTGTGKTAAFALPILQRLSQPHKPQSGAARKIRTLVLAPTRELSAQIADSFRNYGKHLELKGTVIFGGVSQYRQEQAAKQGLDWVVATPGRLLDLVNQHILDLRHVEVLVLDEADHMLDMGFIHDIRRIITKLPPVRQNLLFSATMPPEIRQLANSILRDPVTVEVARVSSTVEAVSQAVYFVEKRNKNTLLAHYINNNPVARALVFTRTKHGADKVARHLTKSGIRAEAIHGNKNQNARVRAIASFKSDNPPVLVATDIAARGLDIDEVSHVVNYDVPNVPETYVHRIGRTGRAGATGEAISFCDREERSFLNAIERLTKKKIAVRADQPEYPAREAQEHEAPAHATAGTRGGPASHPRAEGRHSHQAAHPRQEHAPRRHEGHRSDQPRQQPAQAAPKRPQSGGGHRPAVGGGVRPTGKVNAGRKPARRPQRRAGYGR